MSQAGGESRICGALLHQERGLIYMNKRRSRIDRRWRKPVALTVCFLMIVFTDLLILAKASGVVTTDSDAAGNGMANAFRDGFVVTGFYIVAALTLLFAAIPRKGIRIALTMLLLPATLFFLLLAS